MSQEELYLKKRVITFVKELCHVRGVTPQDETSRKCLKRLIKIRLLMDARTKEQRKVFLVICRYFFPLPSGLVVYNTLNFGDHYLKIQ